MGDYALAVQQTNVVHRPAPAVLAKRQRGIALAHLVGGKASHPLWQAPAGDHLGIVVDMLALIGIPIPETTPREEQHQGRRSPCDAPPQGRAPPAHRALRLGQERLLSLRQHQLLLPRR
jgi:hypothetical protein